MNTRFLVIFILTILWSIAPFFKKRAAKNLESSEYLILNHVVITIILIFYVAYLIMNNKCSIDCIKKMTKLEIFMLILGGFLAVISGICLIYLVKNYDVNMVMPYLQPLVIIATAIFGYLLFKEQLSIYQIIGFSVIILGIIISNYQTI